MSNPPSDIRPGSELPAGSAHKKVSAFVICFNEEKKIERCLKSVAWCDEIVVIDSGSTDATLEIARRYTDRIIQRPWPGHREQKSFGLGECRHEWVLNIDADEVVSDGLRDEIVARLQSDDGSINGFELLRVVFFQGRFWRKGGWHPEYRLRLLRRSAATWGGENPHECALVSGRTARLKGELLHFSFADFTEQLRSIGSLSNAAALSMHRRGIKPSLRRLFLNPIARFVKFYIVRKGYREGFVGLLAAVMEAFSVFFKYARLWEMRSKRSES